MNPRTAKEVRAQSPVFGLLVACALATVVFSFARSPYLAYTKITLVGIYSVACLLMAAMAFGNEFQHRTIALLLSQPVSRQSLWPQKMRVLAGLCGYGALITLIALLSWPGVHWEGPDFWSLLGTIAFLVAVPILFCCTTPYYTLLSKSTLGGIVFTIFGSGMLFVLSVAIWDQLAVFSNLHKLKDTLTFKQLDGPTFVFVILSIPYAALLYLLGRRRFLRLEVIDSQSLEGNLPQGLETVLTGFSGKFHSPLSRLIFKELRLQRISLMLTAAFCLFMVIERLTWNAANDPSFIAVGTLFIYAILFPVIVCSAAVAEEKTWGMKDWHLTLPPSHKIQWRVKWLVALTLSLVLGAGLTWLLSRMGPWRKEFGIGWQPEMLCYPLLIATALYAGSISTSTIRALLITFGMIAAFEFIKAGLFSVFYSFPYIDNIDAIGFYPFVLCVMLAHVYSLALQLLRAVVFVWPVYLTPPSLQVLLLVLIVAGFFWLLLRFARTNYRHSDLVKRKVACQLFIILLATIFLLLAIAGAEHVWHGIPVL